MPKKAKEKLEEISEITTTKKETKAPTREKASAKTTSKSTATKRSPSTKKATGSRKKTSSKKNASSAKAKSTSRKKAIATSMEYYDLPYRYSQTIVKILAQTPSILFVYWDISDSDRENLLKQYGENFFQNTKPYLVVTNEDIHYQFEVEINDYANSWYLHIADSDCKYKVELIRKSIQQESQNHVVYITSSNEMNVPNDHILFDHLGKTVFFQNVKTNVTIEKDISTMSFINRIGKIYNIYDFYQEIYHDELNGDELGIALSSSQFSSHS